MNPFKIGLVLSMMGSAAAFAADAPANPLALRQVATYMEARYQGKVVAITIDNSGDKAAHYHVDLFYPEAGLAKLDVDASTLEISARTQPLQATAWSPLHVAAASAAAGLGGQVIAATLDSVDGADSHYDIDVRLPTGDIARLKVDPVTRQFGWRTPPVVAD